jgi:diacylglycerol kinase (ATP)
MNRKVAFVINPKAGVKKKMDLAQFIRDHFSASIPYDIILWDNKDDFESIRRRVLDGSYTIAVACGGDGTVNQVAATVQNTPVALGILPLGSGNGLARSLSIPMDLKKALKVIEKASVRLIDGGSINGHPFFCTCGVGFDAHIAGRFASSTKRGFWTYFKITLKEFFSYKPHRYTIKADDETFTTPAFLITVANAGQWGNDVYIAPKAKLDDGIFHISVLKPFSNFTLPGLGIKLMNRKVHHSRSLHSMKGKNVHIAFEGTLPVHFDGEPTEFSQGIDIRIQPASLKVVC